VPLEQITPPAQALFLCTFSLPQVVCLPFFRYAAGLSLHLSRRTLVIPAGAFKSPSPPPDRHPPTPRGVELIPPSLDRSPPREGALPSPHSTLSFKKSPGFRQCSLLTQLDRAFLHRPLWLHYEELSLVPPVILFDSYVILIENPCVFFGLSPLIQERLSPRRRLVGTPESYHFPPLGCGCPVRLGRILSEGGRISLLHQC